MNNNIRIAKQLIRIAKMLVKASYGVPSVFEDEKFVDMTDADFYDDYVSEGIDAYPEFEDYFNKYIGAIKEQADKLTASGYDREEAAEKAVMDFGESCGHALEGTDYSKHKITKGYGRVMNEIMKQLH